jgi:hypothetical protein
MFRLYLLVEYSDQLTDYQRDLLMDLEYEGAEVAPILSFYNNHKDEIDELMQEFIRLTKSPF